MLVSTDIAQLRQAIGQWRRQGETIAFVPTMGNLHQGHLTLVKEAQQRADKVVVSIFVNPMQFDRAEDLEAYPRTLQQDSDKLRQAGVDLLFTPSEQLLYPEGVQQHTYVEVPGISERLEGALRPGHFRGVSTVVTKLFNLVQPDIACFGQKDYQQLALIRKMVYDLALPIEIIGVPTVREPDGLAMSSRNGYLTASERAIAPALARAMARLAEQLPGALEHLPQLTAELTTKLNAQGFRTDAIDIVDADSLLPLDSNSRRAVILLAAYLGKARLIDNQVVELH